MLKLIISEPWDFTSSDGDNILIVKVLERNKDVIIAKSLSDYSGKEGCLIISPRDKYDNLNICQKSENGEMKFCMIGKDADKYNRKN